MKKLLSLLLAAVLVLSMLTVTLASCSDDDDDDNETTDATDNSGTPNNPATPDATEVAYSKALEMIELGAYEKAYEALVALGDYKDSKDLIENFIYLPYIMIYDLKDRSGTLAITFGEYNLPYRMISDGSVGRKDGTYTFNSKGYPIKQSINHNGVDLAYDYTYDDQDRLIRAVYTEDGAIKGYNSYSYTEEGYPATEASYVGDVLQYEYKHYYNEAGYRIKSEYSAPELMYIDTFTYNAENQLVQHRTENTVGEYYFINYTYDAEGRRTSEICIENDAVVYTETYTYDNAGNFVKSECIYDDGYIEILTKAYDEHGNVILETFADSDGGVQTVETLYTLVYTEIDDIEYFKSYIAGLVDMSYYY